MNNQFSSRDICVLTPTKDRPHKIVNLLKSLSEQSDKVGRVIIVGSGQNIEKLVMAYSDKLPVEYYHCEVPGQIRQRKLGVEKLDARTKLVATLDDDIVLEKDTIKNLLFFWNSKDEKTVGVGFNISNMKPHRYSKIRELFFASSKEPAKVLKSGLVTQLTNVAVDIKAEWLNGGTTSWRQDILVEKIHKRDIDAKWAPCEDLLFSYPIGKEFDLYVCASAKVIHDDILISELPFSALYYRGKILTYWLLYFVKENKDLSVIAWFIAIFTMATAELLISLAKCKPAYFGSPIGRYVGVWKGLIQVLRKRDIAQLIY